MFELVSSTVDHINRAVSTVHSDMFVSECHWSCANSANSD